MAEAEDVITDAARHATVFARELWLRHRQPDAAQTVTLKGISQRLTLLITAALGMHCPLRLAQPPPPVTFLSRLFRRESFPQTQAAIPATDGMSLWLPAQLGNTPVTEAMRCFRCMALAQAVRARRGSASLLAEATTHGVENLYLLVEAHAAEHELGVRLPGLQPDLAWMRANALARRPAVACFPSPRRPLEALTQAIMRSEPEFAGLALCPSARESLNAAILLAQQLRQATPPDHRGARPLLYKDEWTGELRLPVQVGSDDPIARAPEDDHKPARSAQLPRRPEVRKPDDDEDDERPGAWMIQTAPPQEHAEDPFGMQRPADRDEDTAADELADSLSELPEARLVTTPAPAKEFLLSEEPPESRVRGSREQPGVVAGATSLAYPEWDYRTQGYRHPGARVHLLQPRGGSRDWVEQTLRRHRALADSIRRRFEMLRAQRMRLRRQLEGEELDMDAYVDARADLLAGQPIPQALYQTVRCIRRDLAITVLIDISGSTDAWVSGDKRVIDVEREALLLVCIALEGLGEPYNVLAFSGEGPNGVTLQQLKGFDESYGMEVALRIAALEPDRYTRAGAAMRHATALLLKQASRHRLLLLLSDGKPNDIDEYEGRYGAEDMRQATTEARLQGIFPFCLTIDRQAAAYLPQVFGAHQYALLTRPELLPTVLLEWLKRLIGA